MRRETDLAAKLVSVVRHSLRDGQRVELDGLGILIPDSEKGVLFIPETAPRVFIAHVEEDAPEALRLADALTSAGLKVWIDKRMLLPGQDWRRAIERAIERCDFFLACFSRVANRKRGEFPVEMRIAMRCAERMPLDDSLLVPVRFEDCLLPQRIQASTQHVDLFPDWDAGVANLVRSMEGELASRRLRDAA